MKVLGLLTAYPPTHCAGSEVMVHTMLRPLAARGHQVDVVLSRDRGPAYDLDGVRVQPTGDKTVLSALFAGADVIVAHLENVPRALALRRVHGVPVVQVCHNTNAHTHGYVERGGDLLVVNSQHMAAAFADAPAPTLIVRPPVDPVEYATTPGGAITLINVSEEKGSETFYRLAERFPERPFLAVEGAYNTQVIDDLANVEVLPHVPADRMRDEVYARTRILLMPSERESWGRVGVEAMASGIPVIAHPTDGLRESLGAAGVFCDRDDIEAWERELRLLLDGRRWRAASRKAKARAAELNPAADLAAWVEAIETLGERRARVRARLTR